MKKFKNSRLSTDSRKLQTLALNYRKIPKISPGAYIFQRSFLRDLYSEGLIYGGKLAFRNGLGSRTVGSKFTVFALFYFLVEGNFASTSPRGLIFGGAMVFCVSGLWGLYLWGLIHGRAYFRNFTYTVL